MAGHLAHRALVGVATLAIAAAVAGCGVRVPMPIASLPKEFPADFPTPPGARLLAATGPLPFMPEEARGVSAEWSSSLSRSELEDFYGKRHGAWNPDAAPQSGPSAGPVSLGTFFLLRRAADGLTATVLVGLPNMIDSGTLVQVTILPPRPRPTPTPP